MQLLPPESRPRDDEYEVTARANSHDYLRAQLPATNDGSAPTSHQREEPGASQAGKEQTPAGSSVQPSSHDGGHRKHHKNDYLMQLLPPESRPRDDEYEVTARANSHAYLQGLLPATNDGSAPTSHQHEETAASQAGQVQTPVGSSVHPSSSHDGHRKHHKNDYLMQLLPPESRPRDDEYEVTARANSHDYLRAQLPAH